MSVAVAADSSVSADRSALALLSGAAVALSGPADAEGLLVELVAGVRRALDANRASLLLLEPDGRRLAPTIAVARQEDDELWQRFRQMPPIDLDDLPGAREVFDAGRVLVVDATQSELVPPQWQRAFELRGLALAPVREREAAVGLLAVEQAGEPCELSQAQLTLLEGMAALVGVALCAVREAGQVRPARSLLDWTRAIAGATSERAIAERTLSGILEVSGATEGLFALLHGQEVEVLAVRGMWQPEPGKHPIASVPEGLRVTCARAWRADPHRPVAAFVDGRHVTLLPLVAYGQVIGAAALATSAPLASTVAPEVLAEAAAVSLRAARRAASAEWARQALDVSAQLFTSSQSGIGFRAALEANWDLLTGHGLCVLEVVGADSAVARGTGLAKASGELAAIVNAWRRSTPPDHPVDCDASLAFPLVGAGAVVGAMLVKAAGEVGPRELGALRLVCGLAGQAIAARAEASRRTELSRVAAQAAAHQSIAIRCYTDAGQLIGRLLEAPQPTSLPQARTQQGEQRLALGQLRRLLRDAWDALSLTPPPGAGLKGALGAFARRVQARTGTGVALQTTGRLPRLEPASQVALLHALTELTGALRDGRAALIQINVAADADTLTVDLGGDGLLSAASDPEGVDLHGALRRSRAWLAPVAGAAEHRVERGGVRFSLAVPARTRRRPPPLAPYPGSEPAHRPEVVTPLS